MSEATRKNLDVDTYCFWADGSVTHKVVDWEDRYAVRGFAKAAHACLTKKGFVLTTEHRNDVPLKERFQGLAETFNEMANDSSCSLVREV
jgi:hypothetical protein